MATQKNAAPMAVRQEAAEIFRKLADVVLKDEVEEAEIEVLLKRLENIPDLATFIGKED